MLKIYSDQTHYDWEQRGHLFPLLRSFWKRERITDKERERIYGPHVRLYRLVPGPDEADICILPMSWPYYYETGSLDKALEFVGHVHETGRPVVTWEGSDYSTPIPVENVYLFRANGYQSRRRPLQHAIPPFFDDPIIELGQTDVVVRTKGTKPSIGFCGLGGDTILRRLVRPTVMVARKIQYRMNLSYYEPHPLPPATVVRSKALRVLGRSKFVETNFIKRTRYAGGSTKHWGRHRREFLENIQKTEYTLCVRGTANYSTRFFETLALGRIPIVVDTDCIFPCDHTINWKKYCVWTDQRQIHELPKRIRDFHDRLEQPQFGEVQKACRRLWLERLSYNGFFSHFWEYFSSGPINRSFAVESAKG